MINRSIFVILLLLTSCIQEVVEPLPSPTTNIFSQKENRIQDGYEISFALESQGIYFLTLIDVSTNQVVSKEKISGIKGINKKNIYIKSIQSRYLYLVLYDIDRKEINRTKLVF
jgi:hypothetical protein